MQYTFTATFEQDGDWWIGQVVEVPAAFTQGKTLEEARENLKEVLLLMLDEYRKEAQEIAIHETLQISA